MTGNPRLRAPSLSGWLAAITAVIATAAVVTVSIAAIGSLRRLAATEGLTRVELAVVAAREAVYQSTADLLTAARVLAERPTLNELILEAAGAGSAADAGPGARDSDRGEAADYLRRYCEAAELDACAVVRDAEVLAGSGERVAWPEVAARARIEGDRFLVPPGAEARPFGGAVAGIREAPGARVFVLRSIDPVFATRLSERAGLEIRIREEGDGIGRRGADAGVAAVADDMPGTASSDGLLGQPVLRETPNAYSATLDVTTSTGEPVVSLVAVLPAAEVMRPVQTMTERLLVIAAAVAVLAVVAGVFVGRHWISGVDRLTAAARRIGAGDLAEPVPAEKGAELGILAVTMEKLRSNLLEIEAARRTRDAVLANISHEFRTPLAAQLASIELLHDGLGTMPADQQRELVESLERGAKRQTRLIDNLLESVRIESGQLSIRRQDVALDEVIEAARDLIEPLLRQRGQRLSIDLASDLPTVAGDRQRLVQVLVNLLANASKFAPAGSPIEVGAASTADGIAIRVDDQGPGPAVPDDAVLFGQFQRGRGDDPDESGLGLGLFIVRSIVERHGGRVSISRTERQTTRALVVLPLRPASPERAEPSDGADQPHRDDRQDRPAYPERGRR